MSKIDTIHPLTGTALDGARKSHRTCSNRCEQKQIIQMVDSYTSFLQEIRGILVDAELCACLPAQVSAIEAAISHITPKVSQ